MGDIAKGVLGGAWSLLVGWVLPTALNLAVFFFTAAPNLQNLSVIQRLWPSSEADTTLVLLVAAVLFGLVLNALQVPLYRVLEGYLLWPAPAYRYGCDRHRAAKRRLAGRLERLRGDGRGTPVQRSLLEERLSRYPIDDAQFAPTRLGNAIRRFEEYGHNRYRLDTQTLWNELVGTAPDEIRRQVETARTSVDFFVALLYGHLAVALTTVAAVIHERKDIPLLLTTASCLVLLLPVWYRCAVASTDEWAAAVRALVNVGRIPLADSLGLELPQDLAKEREMWTLVTRMSRRPYRETAVSAFAPYRADLTNTARSCPPPGP
ncbi:hypothetical protein AB0H92_28740 [Streptomyces phaeochromogenes]|uniref:hypothetical protein n=1 Tax=Streptomyces phaeochromogenes TaxID=1923 RepID=UPI0034109B19